MEDEIDQHPGRMVDSIECLQTEVRESVCETIKLKDERNAEVRELYSQWVTASLVGSPKEKADDACAVHAASHSAIDADWVLLRPRIAFTVRSRVNAGLR